MDKICGGAVQKKAMEDGGVLMEDYFEPDDGFHMDPDSGDIEVIMAEQEDRLREVLGPYYDLWEGK